VLHQRQHPAGHEAGRADGRAASRHLGDLDNAPSGGDFDPPTDSGRDDVVGAGLATRVDDDLDPVTFHSSMVVHTASGV
jgi:hypothetical protein